MNVLTLTSQDQVDKYSSNDYKLLKEGNYDKVVLNGITNLSGDYVSHYYMYDNEFLFYVPEIEIQNCTIDGSIMIFCTSNPLKITIKDSTIQGFTISELGASLSVVMDNVTQKGEFSSIDLRSDSTDTYTGKSLLLCKNSKLKFYSLDINRDIWNIELSNNHDMKVNAMSIDLIPDNKAEQSKFLSQFADLTAVVTPSKIDEFNYQFEQADWNKLTSLLDAYPNLFKTIKFSASFRSVLERISTNNIYIHIPSLSFPLCWIHTLDYNVYPPPIFNSDTTMTAKDYAWFYLNKNNGHNFTITHFNECLSDLHNTQQDNLQGLLIADNYKDFITIISKYSCNLRNVGYGLIFDMRPCTLFYNILSGKMVTSEITLMPNTYFRIRTIGSDMKIKSIKEVTRFHAKTIKVTGMKPFMILSYAGTTCLDIDGKVEIGQAKTGSKVFLNGSITIKSLCMADINVDATIQQKTYTDIIGSVITNQIESFIDGDITVPDIKKKIIIGTVNVRSIVSATTITGEITINQLDHIDYELDGSFQLAQAVSTDIIGVIEVKVCRIEILGYLEISMKGV